MQAAIIYKRELSINPGVMMDLEEKYLSKRY